MTKTMVATLCLWAAIVMGLSYLLAFAIGVFSWAVESLVRKRLWFGFCSVCGKPWQMCEGCHGAIETKKPKPPTPTKED